MWSDSAVQVTILLLAFAAAVLSLASVTLGLFSTLTGKDPLPIRARRLLRRVPASEEDFRIRGMSLTLNGAAAMLIASILTTNVVGMLNSGHGSFAVPAFPKYMVFLITLVAAIAAMVCFFGSYALLLRVRYTSTRALPGGQPGMPPA